MDGARVLPALAILLVAAPAYGHEMWLERDGGGVALYSGHRSGGHDGSSADASGGEASRGSPGPAASGDARSGHGPNLLQYKPEWIAQGHCLDADGKELLDAAGKPAAADHTGAYPYRIDAPCALAAVALSSGYWTKTPYGTDNLPKTEARMPIRSWLSYETVKRVDIWGAAAATPLGKWLEISPCTDPFSLDAGDKLALAVTLDGEPAQGAVVSYDGEPRGSSGADGKINIRLRHGGFQSIQAEMRVTGDSEKADEIVYTAGLNFELPGK